MTITCIICCEERQPAQMSNLSQLPDGRWMPMREWCVFCAGRTYRLWTGRRVVAPPAAENVAPPAAGVVAPPAAGVVAPPPPPPPAEVVAPPAVTDVQETGESWEQPRMWTVTREDGTAVLVRESDDGTRTETLWEVAGMRELQRLAVQEMVLN